MKSPFGRGITLHRELTNHGYWPLTKWDDPPSIDPCFSGDFWWIRSHGMKITMKNYHLLKQIKVDFRMLRSWGFTPLWEFPPRAKTNLPHFVWEKTPLHSIPNLHLQSPRSPRKNSRKTAARTNLLAEQHLETMLLKHQLKTKKRTALAFFSIFMNKSASNKNNQTYLRMSVTSHRMTWTICYPFRGCWPYLIDSCCRISHPLRFRIQM